MSLISELFEGRPSWTTKIGSGIGHTPPFHSSPRSDKEYAKYSKALIAPPQLHLLITEGGDDHPLSFSADETNEYLTYRRVGERVHPALSPHNLLQLIPENMPVNNANTSPTDASTAPIKQEPNDDGIGGRSIDLESMSVTQLMYTLHDLSGGNITLCRATERDMYTSCCGQKFVAETADVEPGERILTTYRYYPGGKPTSFNVHGRASSARFTAQCNAEFYHADKDLCRAQAIQDTNELDDLHLVYCRRKPPFPTMNQSCDTCFKLKMTNGHRTTYQTQLDRGESTSNHVFDSENCLREWVRTVLGTMNDTKYTDDGSVKIMKDDMGMQFQMASETSVNRIRDLTGLRRGDCVKSLLQETGTDRERRWL